MLKHTIRQFSKMSATRYIKDHSDVVNNQLDMMNDQMKMYNNVLIAACAGVGYMFHLEKENNDRKFEQVGQKLIQIDTRIGQVESSIEEIKHLVIQSAASK